MKDWILYNWKEISVVLYLVIGLPFAYVWTGEEYQKNTEDPYYSNRYSRNYWFSYVLIFCFAVLFYPIWLLVRMLKKAAEKRRWERKISNMSIVELGGEEKRLIRTSTPDQWSDAVKRVEKVKALRMKLLTQESAYIPIKVDFPDRSMFEQKIDQRHHENWINEMDKVVSEKFKLKKNGKRTFVAGRQSGRTTP